MSFQPDFKHRLSSCFNGNETFTTEDLTDTILLMCERADAIINAISLQFEGEYFLLSNEFNASSLHAASNEIKDIAAVVSAFTKANNAKSNGGSL